MLKDHIQVYDEAYVNGKHVSGGNSADIIGEVEIIYRSRENGKVVFTRKLHKNDLLVTGAVFLSEKMNNMRSTFKTLPIDQELGLHTADEIEVTDETIGKEKVCGLMIGNGGAGDTYNTVYKVVRADQHVPGMIPFRVVPVAEDLSATDRAKYILRKVEGDYVYYYGKKFDIARTINVQFEDGTTVPVDVDGSIVTKFIKTYTVYRVTVEQRDVREYFKITQGSTLRSLINSLGLITGYKGDAPDGPYDEYFNVRGMTCLNMENHELKDSEGTITVIYRLFIQ